MAISDLLSSISKKYLRRFGPNKYTNTIFTCTKDEDPYALEWICYHYLLGFTNVVIITNNNSDKSVELFRRLKTRYEWFDYIDHHVGPDRTPGIESYRLLIEYIRKNGVRGHGCLCDIDEFLVLEVDDSISQLWNRFEGVDVVGINWRIFGSSGALTRENGLVIERFTRCAPDAARIHREFKSLFKVDGNLVRINNHYPTYADADRRIYVHADGLPMNPELLRNHPYSRYSRPSFGIAQFNHYIIKSREEFEQKRKRGRLTRSLLETVGSEDRYTEQFFRSTDLNQIIDERAKARAPQVRSMMETIYGECSLADLFERGHIGL